MRLVAQRVQSALGQQGINAFYYAHGPDVWLDKPPPEIAQSPGHLLNAHVEVRPPGNSVRSYLEIVAPDGVANGKIEADVVGCIDLFTERQLPLKVQSGDSTF